MKERWVRERELVKEVVVYGRLTAEQADKILYDEYGGHDHSITLYLEKIEDM